MTSSSDLAASRRLLNVILIVGVLDALLLLVLLYFAFVNRDEAMISLLGPIHGMGFLALLALTAKGARDARWGWWFPVAVLVTGGPLGSIIGELRVRRALSEPVPA